MSLRMPIKPSEPPQKTIARIGNNRINVIVWIAFNIQNSITGPEQSKAAPATPTKNK